MGNENSTPVADSTPPQTLEARTLSAVANFIQDGRAKRVVVMTGAGISTAAGIPDFRSPKTGLYHNLARLNLPHAEAVFEIEYFKKNPDPFYVLAKELYPGKFQPTVSHVFIALLAKKNLLRMLFTQNIDCLERAAGVPGARIVEAHGSFAAQRCVECKAPYPDKEMREHVEKGEPPRCIAGCGGLVKPDIVFFGEQLPETFYANRTEPAMCDLVLVLGTSLSVHPFASLPQLAMEGTPRVLFNKEKVGDMGTRPDDVLVLGDCDSGVRKLADELGWRDELEKTWKDIVGEEEARRQLAQVDPPIEKRPLEDWEKWGTEDEVGQLTKAVENKLDLSGQKNHDHGADGIQDGDEGTAAEGGKGTAQVKTEEGDSKGISESTETVSATPRAVQHPETSSASYDVKGSENVETDTNAKNVGSETTGSRPVTKKVYSDGTLEKIRADSVL
ncbi:NAD-dependent deacetylase sirtuin-2 [Xylariales sp. AK1849]|nr:NAD-dependent deacetylase sirtuin-2 [Xylariales sp. AK1849]